MGRVVRYHPWFSVDVLEAAAWYDQKKSNLGAEFVGRVARSVSELIADPERRLPSDCGVRYWPIGRFPYIVFFDVTDFEVLIVGVMHTSRESRAWLGSRYNPDGGVSR